MALIGGRSDPLHKSTLLQLAHLNEALSNGCIGAVLYRHGYASSA